jgi:hypothetical protein
MVNCNIRILLSQKNESHINFRKANSKDRDVTTKYDFTTWCLNSQIHGKPHTIDSSTNKYLNVYRDFLAQLILYLATNFFSVLTLQFL